MQANTDYNVTLQGDCSANSRGTSDISDQFEFTTLCSATALPFFEDFENGVVGETPECWYVVQDPSTITSTADKGCSISKKSFKLQSSDFKSSIVATMPFAHAANDMEVDFMINASAGATLTVGLMSNVCDTSTFEQLYTTVITDGGVWKNYRFNTANTTYGTTTNLHVAFAINSGATRTCYLDKVDIHSIPSCLRSENLKVINYDTISVTLDWVDYSVTPSGNYVIEVYNKDDEVFSYVNATTRPFTVTNLVEHTNYEFRIRNMCSSTDSSQWSVLAAVHTACLANMNLPFLEDFNSSSKIPPCWKELLPGWKINIYDNTEAIHTGYSLKSPNSQNGHYLIASEPVYIPVANAYDVSFYMYRIVDAFSKSEKERALIWVNNIPSLEGAILLDSIHPHAELYPEEEITSNRMMQYFYKIPLQGKVYILFETYHNWRTDMYFDDVAVDVHVCRGILKNLAFNENLSSKTIKATWNTITEETQWLVDFVLKDENNDTLCFVNDFLVNTKEFTYDFSSVYSANMDYNYSVTVRALCTGNDTIESGISGSRSFTTPCLPVALPINNDFEGSVFPSDCWSISTDPNSVNPGNKWQKNTSSSTAYIHSGTASAKFPDANATTIGYLNTPLFHAEVGKTYLVSYYQYRYYGTTDSRFREGITIWLTQSPSDTIYATKLGFVPRFNINGEISSSGMYKYFYEFTVPQDGDYFIMIQATQEYGGSNFVDDVLVMEKPVCYNLQDNSVSITSLLDGVQITISDSTATKVEFVVCGADVVSDSIKESDIHHVFNVTSTNNTTTISGLQPETRYNLFWRNICDVSIGNYSDWCLTPISFSTKYQAFEVNNTTEFFDGFETYYQDATLSNNNSCYIIDSNKDFQIVGGIGSSTSQVGIQCTPYEGDKQLAIVRMSNGSFKRALQLKAGKNYEVSVYARMDDIYEDNASISLFYQQEGSTTNNVWLLSTYVNSNTWNLYSAYFSVPTDGIYYVGLEEMLDGSPCYLALDNFRVRELPCDSPTQNEIIAITDTSFSVQISSNYFNSWEVRVCTSEPDINLSDPQAVIVDTIASQSFTIDNLQANTDYWYIIRSLCNNIASDWSAPIHFVTNCVEQSLPYINSFETDMGARCWHNVSVAENTSMTRSTSYAKSGNSSLKLIDATAVSPKLGTTSLANYMITGWVYAVQDSASTINIGVTTNPNDNSSFEVISTIDIHNGNVWSEFVAYFNVLNDANYVDFANAQYITISTDGDDIYYFDDISIEEVENCGRPQQVLTTVVANSVNVEIVDSVATHTQWQYVYGIGDIDPNSLTPMVTNSKTFTISGLQYQSDYTLYVRTYCSITEVSTWYIPYNFSIGCITQGAEYYGFACPNQDYVGNGFNVPASQLVIGDTTTIINITTGLNGDCDTLNTIHIYVPQPIAPIVIYDTICEGQEYYGYGFTLNDIVSDTVVTRTVKTTEGCDSIVELTLDFIPTVRVAITATINEGETYEFGGNSLSQAGEYEY
ncbi:MAG: fibronectin type III domain-containing protein, partial [Candidatus Aphodosoma sp.]